MVMIQNHWFLFHRCSCQIKCLERSNCWLQHYYYFPIHYWKYFSRSKFPSNNMHNIRKDTFYCNFSLHNFLLSLFPIAILYIYSCYTIICRYYIMTNEQTIVYLFLISISSHLYNPFFRWYSSFRISQNNCIKHRLIKH